MVFDVKDPSTWTLPIQAYLPSDSEMAQISQARKQLIADCMEGFGFEWTPAPDLPRVGGKNMLDWRYGIHDIALAEVRGYKPDAENQEAYDQAMEDGAVDGTAASDPESQALDGTAKEMKGKKVPPGGCQGQADELIDGEKLDTPLARGVNVEVFMKSQESDQVVKAFSAWSACMKGKGYDYAAPLDASDDPRFASKDVTPLEISTATADIDCREKTDVSKIWYDAEMALQTRAIEEKAEQLNHERESLDTAVRKAAEVVEGAR
ncbi:hypothetical protein [Streptomyces liangshanensis]|uniref:hypothetical protein n=1 Tax=Streptomyces liangshanensis TaxID=2717324 RepID=UPI0036DD5856